MRLLAFTLLFSSSLLACGASILSGCSQSRALRFADLMNIQGQSWKLEEMKDLEGAIQKQLDTEGLETADYDSLGVVVGLNISTDRYLGEGATLSVGVCNGVGASYKIEGTSFNHSRTIISPAGCSVIVKYNETNKISHAPLAIEHHYQDIAPQVRYVYLSKSGDMLVFKDKNLDKLAVFTSMEAAE